jgi:hypothetical protein
LLLVLLVAALGAGCGGDDEDDGDSTVTVTEGAPAETAPPQAAEDAAPVPAKRGPAFFSTPSKNISCQVSPEFARCDIAEKAWKPTAPTEPCELDYGHGIQLISDGAEFVCAGDTALGARTILPYGEEAQRGLIRCTSAAGGVTCSNLESGHGFLISRQRYEIY